jgi:chromosome segregation ATPase
MDDQQRIDFLEDKISEKDQRIKELARDLEQAEDPYVLIIEAGNKVIREKNEDLEGCRRELRKRWERIEELNEKIETLKVIASRDDAERETQLVREEQLITEIKRQRDYIEALEHDVKHFKERSDNLDKKIKECNLQWLETHHDAEARARNYEAVIKDLHELNFQINEELSHIRQQIKETLNLIGDRYDRYDELGKVMMALKMLEGIVEEEEDD